VSITRKAAENIASVLSEGLPYIQRFYGKIIVVKYGGAAMSKTELKKGFAKDIALMKLVGMKPIVVHGGGPQIRKELEKAGLKEKFLSGHRVTDRQTMRIVQKVLINKVNKEIVSLINNFGANAASLTYKNSKFMVANKIDKPMESRLKLVGTVKSVRINEIKKILVKDHIPVIAPLGLDKQGNCLNINADVVAGAIAQSLKSEKLILLTDVEGILNKKGILLSKMSPKRAKIILKNEIVKGGMKPKLIAAIKTISNGVKSAHIIDGRVPHAVLLEVLTKEGVGTLIS
tara:strand:+ start:573 stop:1436 length:864 start_codon:yes stop_codon:yes gene_type:complete